MRFQNELSKKIESKVPNLINVVAYEKEILLL